MSLDFTWTRLPDGMLRIDYARGCQPAGYAEIALINEIESLQAELQKQYQKMRVLEMNLVASNKAMTNRSAELNAANLEGLSWKARAEQNYTEWEEANKKIERLEEDVRQYRAMAEAAERERWVDANDYAILKQRVYKLLKQTIEVLEGFEGGQNPATGGWWGWWQDKAKPLLDNLKALKKEPDAHQQAVAEMLAPKPIDHVDGGFKP